MNRYWKTFTTAFTASFTQWFGYGIAFAVGVLFSFFFTPHPYDECRSQYTDPGDISECVWILENQ